MDEIFYSKVASYLNFRGIESNDLQCLWIDDFCAVQPYHYFEIWLTALISYFSGISTLVSYKLLAIPLLFGLACDILFQLSKSYQLSNLKAVFSVILVLTSGLFLGYQYTMDWPLPQTLKIQLHYISDFVPLNRVKLVTIFLFVCAFLFAFLKNIKFNWLILLLAGVLWVTVAPTFWAIAFIILCLGSKRSSELLRFFGFALISVLFFVSLYYLGREKAGFDDSVIFLKYRSPKIILGTIFYEFLSHFVILIPFLLLKIIFKVKGNIRLYIILILLLIPGFVLHALTIGSVDSFQFVSNISAIVLPFFYYFLFLDFRFKLDSPIPILSLFSLFLIQSFFFWKTIQFSLSNYQDSYSSFFIKKLGEKIDKTKHIRVVSLSESKGGFHDMPQTNITGSALLFSTADVSFAQIDIEDFLASLKGTFQSKVKNSTFASFFYKNKFSNYPEARVGFIKYFRPDLLWVKGGNVNINDYPELRPYLGEMIKDEVSKDRVFFLKYN
jgi:hypothetical protein